MSELKLSNLEIYEKSYEYKELLKKHSLTDEGVWEILGEDPNCDMGGSHHQPKLAVVSGRLGEVIKAAVDMKSFWTWGSGGSIRFVKIISLNDLAKKAALNKEKQKLEERIKAIEAELNQSR